MTNASMVRRSSNPALMTPKAKKTATGQKQFTTIQNSAQLADTKKQSEFYNAKWKAKRKALNLSTNRDLGQDKYLKLLVTQLRHQDPTSPIKNHAFAAQMAQFSALEQMTKLNSSMNKMLATSNASANYNLLGKQIDWVDPISKTAKRGVASSLHFKNGKPVLKVGMYDVAVKDIISVKLPGAGK